MFGGYGINYLWQKFSVDLVPRLVLLILFLLCLLPYAFHTMGNTFEMRGKLDPRVEMADYLQKNVPKGKSLLILDETRWYLTEEEKRAYKIQKATVPQLIQEPTLLSGADICRAPAADVA